MAEKKMKSLNGYEIVDQHARDNMLDKEEAVVTYAPKSHNHSAANITSGTLSSDRLPTISINKGGTGATTPAQALTNLGITATVTELNKLDGVTVTTTEINYVDGVRSNIQAQIDAHTSNTTAHVTTAERDNWNEALPDAKEYTDARIQSLIGDAPQTLDTIKEVADALKNNPDVIDTLNSTIGEKLSISGGTMTGILTAKANQYTDAYTGALNMNNSNIYGVNSVVMADRADGAQEGIQWYRDDTHVDSQWVQDGVMYFTPNRLLGGTATNHVVLHTGNYASLISSINTWRPVVNNLTSTSTTSSLSAAQGKVLNDTKLSLSGGRMTGSLYADKDVVIPSAKSVLNGTAPFAGTIDEGTANYTEFRNYKSIIGSAKVNDVWQNVINVRHRNGWNDGNSYGMYIRSNLTSNGSLFWNKQTGSEVWQGERQIIDSAGGTLNGRLTANGRITLSRNGGSFINGVDLNYASVSLPDKNATDTSHYYPVIAGKTYNSHVWNLGTIGDKVGFYLYKSGRTDNGYDTAFTLNVPTGEVISSGNITAPRFVGALNGNATTATTLQTARTINGTSFNGSDSIITANWGTARTLTVGKTAKTVNGSGNVSWSLAEIGALPTAGGTMTGVIRSQYASGSWINSVSNSALNLYHSSYGGVFSAPVKSGRVTLSTYPASDNNVYLGYASSSQISSGTNSFNKSIRWDASSGVLYAPINGSLTGNASSATQLQNARTIRTNLASTSTASFNGTANITPGVTGTLPIANGGTGATTAANACSNIGALPKSGGTMTGALYVKGTGYLSDNTFNVGEELAKARRMVLFNNDSNGLSSNASFSSAPSGGAARFIEMEIYYKTDDGYYSSVKVRNPYSKVVLLTATTMGNNGVFWTKSKAVKINSYSIDTHKSGGVYVTGVQGSNGTVTRGDYIAITGVVGYFLV